MDEGFRRLADSLPAMVWQADATMACTHVNRRWEEFTGRAREAALAAGWQSSLHPDDLVRVGEAHQAGCAAAAEVRLEYRLRRHDGEWRWVLDEMRPVVRAGILRGFLGICVDITDMKQALAQRDALLQELQHRVRNNAQVTSSFLSMQAARAEDATLAEALRAAAARVLLSTQVQERLFRVPADAEADLATEVAAAARAAFALFGRQNIRLDMQLGDGLRLPVHRAAPLALIVTELMSNALRHAFPEGSGGGVRLLLDSKTPRRGLLLVADDGVGLRQQADGLGLHLVKRLASQAGAVLTLHGRGGTEARLEFDAG